MGRRKKQIFTEEKKGRFSSEELADKVFKKKILTGKEVQEKLSNSSTIIQIAKKGIDKLSNYFSQAKFLFFYPTKMVV